MSVRGEFRRLARDLVGALRDAERARAAAALELLVARAEDDLSGAAQGALEVLAELEPPAPGSEPRLRYDDARERLGAVCRIILGR